MQSVKPQYANIPAIAKIAGDDRLTTFPISRPGIWAWYKDSQRCFWVPEDIDLTKDRDDYANHQKMTPGIRHFIDHVNALFASLDKMVNINIVKRFKEDFEIYECDAFYDFQVAMENIHGETYSLILDTLVPDPNRKKFLLESVQTMPVIKKMADWISQCVSSGATAGERLLRMACVEGIFFIGAFCAIYWLQEYGNGMMKGMSQANELIARDESLHTMFAMYLYTLLTPEHRLSNDEIRKIFRDAVDIASEFVREALPSGLPGMNSDLMIEYLECQVDNLATLIDLPPIYGSKSPFGFMQKLNNKHKNNFFERRSTDYAKPQTADVEDFEVAENF